MDELALGGVVTRINAVIHETSDLLHTAASGRFLRVYLYTSGEKKILAVL